MSKRPKIKLLRKARDILQNIPKRNFRLSVISTTMRPKDDTRACGLGWLAMSKPFCKRGFRLVKDDWANIGLEYKLLSQANDTYLCYDRIASKLFRISTKDARKLFGRNRSPDLRCAKDELLLRLDLYIDEHKNATRT